jgi:hypothetical protein
MNSWDDYMSYEEYADLMELFPDESYIVFPYKVMDGAGLKSFLSSTVKRANDLGKKLTNLNATDYLTKLYYKIPDKFRPSKEQKKLLKDITKEMITPKVKAFSDDVLGGKATKYIEDKVNDVANGREVSIGNMMKDYKGSGLRKKRATTKKTSKRTKKEISGGSIFKVDKDGSIHRR